MARSALPTLWQLLISVPRRPVPLGKAAICLLALLMLRGINWAALAIDRVCFPQFQGVSVTRPLFIVGPPRSGTTLLHRLMASQSQRFTTPPLWELLFAPAICQKYLFLGIARLDRLVGRPLSRLVTVGERLLLQSHAHIHPTSLSSPEEDSLALLSDNACFLIVAAFPNCDAVWRLGFFDEAVDEATRLRVLEHYKQILQRHLYVRGRQRHVLSKNPAFSGWIDSLRHTFPDARLVAPWRNPHEVVASQLSSLQPSWESFGYDASEAGLVDHFIELLSYYYRTVERHFLELPVDQGAVIGYASLLDLSPADLAHMLTRLGYDHLDEPALAIAIERSRRPRPKHKYSLAQYGLDEETLRGRFPASSWTSEPESVFENRSCDDSDRETEGRQNACHLSATTIQ
ncbi:MAG: sulfotransferase [Planctomycetota bacterium]